MLRSLVSFGQLFGQLPSSTVKEDAASRHWYRNRIADNHNPSVLPDTWLPVDQAAAFCAQRAVQQTRSIQALNIFLNNNTARFGSKFGSYPPGHLRFAGNAVPNPSNCHRSDIRLMLAFALAKKKKSIDGLTGLVTCMEKKLEKKLENVNVNTNNAAARRNTTTEHLNWLVPPPMYECIFCNWLTKPKKKTKMKTTTRKTRVVYYITAAQWSTNIQNLLEQLHDPRHLVLLQLDEPKHPCFVCV